MPGLSGIGVKRILDEHRSTVYLAGTVILGREAFAGEKERQTDSTHCSQTSRKDRDRQEVHARLTDSRIMLDNTHHLSQGRDDLS